jgi:acetyl-CoA acyltransferase
VVASSEFADTVRLSGGGAGADSGRGGNGSVVIVGAARTPVAARNGPLGGWHPADLLAQVLVALLSQVELEPSLVDDVITACGTAIGAQSMNVGRQAVLAAGSGLHDVVVAAGVEVMTLVPLGAAVQDGSFGLPFGPGLHRRYRDQGGLLPAGRVAEAAASEWHLTRDDLDRWALESHRKAGAAADRGPRPGDLVGVEERRLDREARRALLTGRRVEGDHSIDRKATLATLAAYKPVYADDGVVTAGNSGPMGDGAAAVLVTTESRASSLGLTPLARVVAVASRGVGPMYLLLAWLRRFDIPPERLNPDGGAIALGQPVGAAGLRALVSLVHSLQHPVPGPAAGVPARGLVTAGAVGGVGTAVVVDGP